MELSTKYKESDGCKKQSQQHGSKVTTLTGQIKL
jgi:hypothetical protein